MKIKIKVDEKVEKMGRKEVSQVKEPHNQIGVIHPP